MGRDSQLALDQSILLKQPLRPVAKHKTVLAPPTRSVSTPRDERNVVPNHDLSSGESAP